MSTLYDYDCIVLPMSGSNRSIHQSKTMHSQDTWYHRLPTVTLCNQCTARAYKVNDTHIGFRRPSRSAYGEKDINSSFTSSSPTISMSDRSGNLNFNGVLSTPWTVRFSSKVSGSGQSIVHSKMKNEKVGTFKHRH